MAGREGTFLIHPERVVNINDHVTIYTWVHIGITWTHIKSHGTREIKATSNNQQFLTLAYFFVLIRTY